MLARALRSVSAQRRKADAVVVQIDNDKVGAALNRDRGLAQVETEWVAFLDDDDEFYSHHLEFLYDHAIATNADLVYPWFDVGSGGTDPFPQFEGVEWNNDDPHQVPITFLVKTEVAREVEGFSGGWTDSDSTDKDGNRAGEHWNFILKLIQAGRKIVHLNERTWIWHHHGKNTSGRTDWGMYGIYS